MLTGKIFLECSLYFSTMYLIVPYIVVKFQPPNGNTFRDKQKIPCWLVKIFLECSSYFSMMYLIVLYIVVKFQFPNYNTFRDMNYFLQLFSMTFGPVRTTDRQTDRKRRIWAHRANSTGGLNKIKHVISLMQYNFVLDLLWQNGRTARVLDLTIKIRTSEQKCPKIIFPKLVTLNFNLWPCPSNSPRDIVKGHPCIIFCICRAGIHTGTETQTGPIILREPLMQEVTASYPLRKFQRYNKACLGELVPLEILGKHQQVKLGEFLWVWARATKNAKVARFTLLYRQNNMI